MIEMWWYFDFDKLSGSGKVDSKDIGKLADVIYSKLKEMQISAKILQESGWELKIDKYALVATTNKFTKLLDAVDSITKAGIDQRTCTLIMK